jgi:hypothetical protein
MAHKIKYPENTTTPFKTINNRYPIQIFKSIIMNYSSHKSDQVTNAIIVEKMMTDLPSAGKERLKADYRMYSGLLLLLGLTASYGSFADILSLAGNSTVNSGLPLANLIAAVVQAFFGTVCMVVGYSGAILDVGNSTLTSIAVGVIQMEWLPFTAGLSSTHSSLLYTIQVLRM